MLAGGTQLILLIEALIVEVIAFCYFFVFGRKTKVLYWFLTLHILIIVWISSYIMEVFVYDMRTKWVSICIAYTSLCFLGFVWLVFVINYTNYTYLINSKIIYVFFTLSALSLIIIIANPYNNLFYKQFDNEIRVYGPMYFIVLIQNHIYTMIGIFLLLKYAKKNTGKEKKQSLYIAIMPFFPIIFNILYNLGFIKTSFDISPVIFSITMLIFSIISFRYKFFDYIPIGVQTAFDTLNTPCILANDKEEIVEMNKAFFQEFGEKFVPNIQQLIKILYEKSQDNIEIMCLEGHIFDIKNDTYTQQISLENDDITKIYTVTITPVKEKNKLVLKLITFSDITDYINMNKEKERNDIAREIHDSLGNTLNVILKIQESVINDFNLKEDVKTSLEKSRDLSTRALRELRMSIYKMSDESEIQRLSTHLNRLKHDFKNIGVNINIYQEYEDEEIDKKLSLTIYKICQESITNSIKHGKATKIEIMIMKEKIGIELYIVDNGLGSKNIVSGFGLKGIGQRLKKYNGKSEFISDGEHGFMVKISIPIGG